MTPLRPIYIVGGAHSTFLGRGHPDFVWRGHPDFGERPNPGLEDHLGDALRGTWQTTGVDPSAIDKAYVSNFLGELFLNQGHLGALLPRVEPALAGRPVTRVEGACASGSLAIASCVEALHAGCNVVLAAGVEVETVRSGKDGARFMAAAAHFATESDNDRFLFPWMFARRAKAYKEAFGATDEDLARVVVKAYDNASRNPQAQMRTVSMSLAFASTTSEGNATFLDDPELRDHLRQSDCTTFTDGASALVLANDEGLARLGIPRAACTQLVGLGHAVSPLGADHDPTQMSNLAAAAAEAYQSAAVSPDQIDVAEVHDCFSIAELQLMEALGFAALGEAKHLLRDGVTSLSGRLPVNPGGGLLGFGHPVGATGIKQSVEVWRQLKGRAGDYQVDRPLTYGITANVGGDDRTGVVIVQRG